MTTRWLRYFWYARPFQPFTLHLADGRVIEVTHPEQLLEQKPTRTCIIGVSADTALIIDLLLVIDIQATLPIGSPPSDLGPVEVD